MRLLIRRKQESKAAINIHEKTSWGSSKIKEKEKKRGKIFSPSDDKN